jgi:hypothetical protein
MFVPFEKIQDSSRIWIYQANRKFNSEESKDNFTCTHSVYRRLVGSWQPDAGFVQFKI